jgi:hypothetical protein
MAATVKRAKGAGGGAADHLVVGAYDVTADGSYPSGGYSVTFPEIPANAVIVAVVAQTPGDVDVRWDYATSKLVFYTKAGAEQSGGANLTGKVVRCTVFADIGG